VGSANSWMPTCGFGDLRVPAMASSASMITRAAVSGELRMRL
jgi:hypothetical protein